MIYVVHNSEWGYPMHLSYKNAKYKDTTYTSYFIAESYREDSKVKKRVLWPIGKLQLARVFPIKQSFPNSRRYWPPCRDDELVKNPFPTSIRHSGETGIRLAS